MLIYDVVEKSLPLLFLCWNGLFCPHGTAQGKDYTLTDLPVHSEKIEPSPIFELQD